MYGRLVHICFEDWVLIRIMEICIFLYFMAMCKKNLKKITNPIQILYTGTNFPAPVLAVFKVRIFRLTLDEFVLTY